MKTEIKDLLLTTAFGFILCMILGFVFFGTTIFKLRYSLASILFYGLYGSIFLSVLKYRNKKETILTAVSIFIINWVIASGNLRPSFLLRDLLYMSSLLGSIAAYKLFTDKFKTLPLFVRSFTLPLFLAITYLFSIFVIDIVYHPDDYRIRAGLFTMLNNAALVGLGIGCGSDIYEKLKSKIVFENYE